MTSEIPEIPVVTTSKPEVPEKPVVTPKPEITTKRHGIAPISTDSPYHVVTGKENNETVVRKQTESPVGTVAVISIAVVVGLAVLVVIVSIDTFRKKILKSSLASFTNWTHSIFCTGSYSRVSVFADWLFHLPKIHKEEHQEHEFWQSSV